MIIYGGILLVIINAALIIYPKSFPPCFFCLLIWMCPPWPVLHLPPSSWLVLISALWASEPKKPTLNQPTNLFLPNVGTHAGAIIEQRSRGAVKFEMVSGDYIYDFSYTSSGSHLGQMAGLCHSLPVVSSVTLWWQRNIASAKNH